MRWLAAVALAAVATALVLTAACGGDDDDASPTDVFTPAGTKADTPTPAPNGSDGGEAPDPPSPQLDEELTEIAASTIVATIDAGGSYTIDTIATAQESSGDSTLSCETSPNFAFGFTWQVQDPYPPNGVQLSWQLDRDSGAIEIANGASGEQTVGCESLKALNGGQTAITVAVNYRVGVIE